MKTLHAPIVAVTVLEDRASVTRRAVVALESGVTQLQIPKVAPVMVDKSVTVSLPERAGDALPVQVVDTRPRRRWVTSVERDGEADPERVKLREELRVLEQELSRRRDGIGRGEQQLAALGELADRTLADVSDDVAWGAFPNATADAMDAVEARELELAESLVGQRIELRERRQLKDDLQGRLRATQSPEEFHKAWIEIDLRADAACEVTVQVTYLVPCAVWRPYHTAELDLGAGEVAVTTDACVWQLTGEDWEGVELTLSTERASLGTEPPPLTTDRLAVRKRQEKVEVEVRTQSIDVLGGGGATKEEGLPGIDDAGEAQHLRVDAKADVPSDGRPHRLKISEFSGDAEVDRVCAPELAAAAVLETRQVNGGSGPLLAGPVDLVMDSGYVGRTSVKYVAAGERFFLGWGPDAEVRVTREEERKHSDAKMLSSFETIDKTVKVRLSNLGAQARTVTLKERVPVSELPDKVKIDVDRNASSDTVAPDDDGILTWIVELPAFGHAERELHYTIRKHQDVRGL